MKALALECEVTTRTVTAWEKGDSRPSDANMDALVEALQFPRGFFEGPALDEIPTAAVSFRALSKMTARERFQAEAAGALAVSVASWIDERFQLPPIALPSLEGLVPEAAAAMLRARWGLGESPIGSMVDLLEAHGVRVFSLAPETATVDAYAFWRGSRPFVFLNTLKSAERGRHDAAHELAHLLLHRTTLVPQGPEREQEANAFAAAFLMPRDSVLAVAPRNPTVRDLIELKSIWKVSVASMLHRLNSLGLLTEWQNRQLWIEIGKLGYRRNEPNGIPRETSQLLRKVFGALRAEGLGRNGVAAQLDIRTQDLDGLVFGLVVTGVDGEPSKGRDAPSPARPSLRLVES